MQSDLAIQGDGFFVLAEAGQDRAEGVIKTRISRVGLKGGFQVFASRPKLLLGHLAFAG